jgi:hypothetical protein
LRPYRNLSVLCVRLSEPFPADPIPEDGSKQLISLPLLSH